MSTSAATQAATDPWKPLYRPVKVPDLAPGAPCPLSTVDSSVDFASLGIAPGVGRGAAYPVGLNLTDSTLELDPPRPSGAAGGAVGKFFGSCIPATADPC